MTSITSIRQAQQAYVASGSTLPIRFRRQQLCRLEEALRQYEPALMEALWIDLHKSYEEAFLTEFSILYAEIATHRSHLRRWARTEHPFSPLMVFPGRSRVEHQPLGSALIIAPWNYPVQLLLNPLIGAISAGCTAMLKPSPYVPHVSAVLTQMIRSTYDEQYIAIVEGHRDVNQQLLAERWDILFFTGSPALARTVMASAAQHLTPLVLELGGKSPCIIDKTADLKVAAKRVAWGKALNAGQTCIAPDYLLVQKTVKDEFLHLLAMAFDELLGHDARQNKHFVRIVSEKAYERLTGYLQFGTVYYGGQTNAMERYISPTILTDVPSEASIWQEEIFGPIFPVQEFECLEDVIMSLQNKEKPLALYYFGEQGNYVLQHTSSGGACINDTIMHIANARTPFGGVGNSGMGRYHGKDSYLAFTHRRTVLKSHTWIDPSIRYMPYRFFCIVQKFFKFLA